VACGKGHMDDFPWVYFVHRGQPGCLSSLKFYEVGASLETANLWVECSDCGKKRSMVEAFGQKDEAALPACRGRHPHLREASGGCTERLKALLLGASNSWFPESRSVLSVPTRAGKLAQLVEQKWLYLGNATNLDVLKAFLKSPGFGEFAEFNDEEIWREVESRRNGPEDRATGGNEESDLKGPEWEVFSKPDPSLNGKDFWLTEVLPPPHFSVVVESVVLGERLREVNALVGFTRLRSAGETSPGETRVRRAPLSSLPPSWVPSTEVRGEGVFIRFARESICGWAERDSAKRRGGVLLQAHGKWRASRGLEPEADFPGRVYAMLHSLSHALMREFSLECGYNSASIRERIYGPTQDGDDRAGLLIYTAAPDSEGTLGGLVGLGRAAELGRLLSQALERASLCASDPLCSEHDPRKDGSLHGAACHACLFAPETSCEIGNRYLDRTMIVPTFRSEDAAFFEGRGT
jgi:hypothetical protein